MKHEHDHNVPDEPIKHEHEVEVKLPEEAKTTVEKVKRHWERNKKSYYGLAICTGCFIAGMRFKRPIKIDFQPVINVMPTMNNTVNNVVENNLGPMSKIVRDVATGQEWQKIRHLAEEIAKEHGIPLSSARTILSKHLNGHSNDVFGKVYEISGLRTDF